MEKKKKKLMSNWKERKRIATSVDELMMKTSENIDVE